ncbi:OmpH family outer membrane protein [Ehrlichia ruminantium]|uniref:OmpH family outer membrane protein n=1 Tax=Ehrlichia ruminantium TaxID=779 RepID=UPI0007C1164F|nr:OmpH family outer membrane protein [Ehrlichia ruminantium]QLK52754.1 OmpH family outer membrane protein [Ehrlichia ruminantium]QLK53676.1 OmpH family outer membrane protein [Ehrlichia ruminantium]QLK54589.1 OmpH family outer membrane protein [Ehrlichia ruminantium]QLK57337.1 OmpH family outer membrane protein [Ehrlichia ruminantium]QLK58254.1 OmpH family outer membrane protein [Ehrlichia ruminantium]
MQLKLFLAIFIILFGVNFQAAAKNDQAIPLAFIDRDVIISEAMSVKSIRTQLDEKRTELQKDFAAREEELHKLEEELSKQKSLLSPEAFEKKVTDFKTKVSDLQQEISVKGSELENMYMNAMEIVYNKIKNISSKIAKENNINLVLFLIKKNQVFYAADGIDFSSQVLERLNKELPNVEIKK